MKDSNKVKTATEEEHNAVIALMRTFMHSNKPKVGIFWYDFVNNSLFGVSKIEPELLSTESETITCQETHEIYWQNQHRIAIAKNNTMSIYYNNDNYAKIPKGRVILENGTFYVNVGSWINESDIIDSEKLRELIVDEFDLPEDICFRHEPQMNIGLVNLNKMNERVISYLKKLGIESVRELTDEQVVSYYLDEGKNTELMLYAENAFENFEREKVIASMRKSMEENVPFYCGYITNESCDGKYKPKEWGWILKLSQPLYQTLRRSHKVFKK